MSDAITKEEVKKQVLIACDLLDHLMKSLEENCQAFQDRRAFLVLDLKDGLNSSALAQGQFRKGICDERTFLQEEQVMLLEFTRQTETKFETLKKDLALIYNAPYGIDPELSKKLKQIIQRFEMVKLDVTENKNVQAVQLSKMNKLLDSQKEASKEARKNISQNLICLDTACDELDEECNKVKCELMKFYEIISGTFINTTKSIDGEPVETPVEDKLETEHDILAEYYDAQKKEFHTNLESLVGEVEALVCRDAVTKDANEMEQAKRDSVIMEKLEDIKTLAKKYACPDDEESNEVVEPAMDQE